MEKDGWAELLKFCLELKSTENLDKFFNLFLTFEERDTLVSRFLIIKALISETMTQREIAEIFQVSIAQITRGSNALKIIDPEFKTFLKTKLIAE